jgi:hypothetical protein
VALQDIEQFLSREVHEGHFDSSGSFSLDESRSLDKLARHQSERPGLWLVKLLQAATALGAEDFGVQQLLGQTRVRFQPARSLPWEDWQQGRASQDPGLRHLQIALQAASTLPHCHFSWKLGPSSHWQVERGAVRFPAEVPGLEPIEIKRHWKLSLSLPEYIRRAALQAEESLLLQELARYAPLAVRLDNRLLNDPVINKPPGLRLGVYVPPFLPRPRPAIPYTSVERIVLSPRGRSDCLGLMDHSLRIPTFLERNRQRERTEGKHLWLQQWVGERWLNAEDWRTLLRRKLRLPYGLFDSRIERNDGLFEIWSDYNRHLGAIAVRGYISLDINRGREGRLYLVRDGLLMKPKVLPEELSEVLILWSASHLNTDLSQLQIIEDEVYAAELTKIWAELEAAARALLEVLRHYGLNSASQVQASDRARLVLGYLENR